MRPGLTLDQILAIIESPESTFWSNGYDSVEVPFPISSDTYLKFAEEDLKDNSERGHVNGLSNAKRSLDARIESILMAFGFYKIAKTESWKMPKKLGFLSDLGILAPRVLTKLTRTRNLIEHEFHSPTREQVEDFVDVVALFHESTKIYLYNLPNDADIGEHGDETFSFKFLRKEAKIILDHGTFDITADDPNYRRLVIGYAHMVRRIYE